MPRPQIQNDCMADDIDIPAEAVAWVPCEVRAYFESGGNELPTIMGGFEGAEIHAHYELTQKRFESTGMDDMLDALSGALFKTTGDSKFKPDEEKARLKAEQDQKEIDLANATREEWRPAYKYKVPHLGEHGSSSHEIDDTNA